MLIAVVRRLSPVATVGTFGVGSSSKVPIAVWFEEAGEDGVRKFHQIRQTLPFWIEVVSKSPSASSRLELALIVCMYDTG